jgi:hypothetical protein
MKEKINPWSLAEIDEEKIKNNRYIHPQNPVAASSEPQEVQASPTPDKITGSYILMPQTNTYAKGVHALQEECKKENNQNHPEYNDIYRPLTFRENIEARVNDFNTIKDETGKNRSQDDRLRFFNKWLDSCAGIAYKKGSTKFKIIRVCEPLIVIDKNFNDGFIPFDYSKIQCAELDSSNGIYNSSSLTKQQFLDHEAWKTAIDDKPLQEEYAKIYFDVLKKTSGLGFYVRQNTNKDELRALCVDSLDYDSNAYGNSNLDNLGSFLRVAQRRR